MDPFARFSENSEKMPEQTPRLRLVGRPPAPNAAVEGSERPSVAFLHEWRAAKIRTSMALHPTNLARAAALPTLRPVR